MNPIDFIRKNLVTQLTDKGYSDPVMIKNAVDTAVDYYKRASKPSRKGRMYDDCLDVAIRYCQGGKRHKHTDEEKQQFRAGLF